MLSLSLLIVAAVAAAFWLLGHSHSAAPTAVGKSQIDPIDQLLPQTQCGACGYNGCRPYARAIADGRADINQCPPGGDRVIEQLATLLGRERKPLNPDYGEYRPPRVAVIDESICIGCVKCINACPVDAIVGAPKQLHTVIESECTGCELCVAPCPVDCITMESQSFQSLVNA